MSKVIDFSAFFPSAAAIKRQGYTGVVAYISPPREAWMKGKNISKSKVDEYENAGLGVAYVWQYGSGQYNPDPLRGWAGGIEDATKAQKKMEEIGKPNHPIFFAVDFDCTLQQWNSTVVKYFKAVNSVLGKQRTGIYGHSRVIAWAQEDDVVATVAPGRVLGWQTKAWSQGVIAKDYAVLYQGTHNISVAPDLPKIDENSVFFEGYGVKPINVTQNETSNGGSTRMSTITKKPGWSGDPVWLPEALKAFGVKTETLGDWKQIGHGDFGRIWGVIAHHTGGPTPDRTSAKFIQDGRSDLRGPLSQIHLAKDGTATIVAAGVAWHAGAGSYPGLQTNNANYYTIGIEAQNSGNEGWNDVQYKAYVQTVAAILWTLDLPASRVIGHKEWSSQGKWDPGKMDMDAFRADVQAAINRGPIVKNNTPKPQGGNVNKSEADQVINFLTDFIKGFLGPVISDTKDVRAQLTGGRNLVYKKDSAGQTIRDKYGNPQVDILASYPGWTQLGQNERGNNLTVVDAIAALRLQVAELQKTVDAFIENQENQTKKRK